MSELVLRENNPLLTFQSWKDLTERAEYFAKSQLIPSHLRGKPADVAIILQYGVELGIPALQAINGITVIQGKPTVSPQLTVSLIRSRIPKAFIKIETDENKLISKVTMARDRDHLNESYSAIWDMEKARDMQLDNKDNYKKQPANMLEWRAIMQAARKVFPDIILGFYSPDELDPSSPSVGKGASLANEIKPKDVVSEVVDIKTAKPLEPMVDLPPVAPVDPEFDPEGDFIVTAPCDFKGKRIKDVERKALQAFLNQCTDYMVKTKKSASGVLLENLTRIEGYLTRDNSVGEMFDNFGGSHGSK